MKKIILALFLASSLFACKKSTSTDDSSAATETKYPVSFSISNFLIETKNMRVETDSTLAAITDVYYYAYGSDGLLKNSIHQVRAQTSAGFGVIDDSLKSDTYTIVVYASSGPVGKNLGGVLNVAALGPQDLVNSEAASFPDVFFKKISVTVNSSGNPVPQPQQIALNRITGLLRVELYNALPDTDPNGAVTVKLNNIPVWFYVKNETIDNRNPPVFTYAKRLNQTTFEAYVIGSTTVPITTSIMYINQTGTTQTKTFNNLIIEANKKTTIKGNLSDLANPTAGDYLISVNPIWSDSTVINLN
ncbi:MULTISPECIES: hypothetical protein [Niastella]|uniref:DUF4397 domain-containing protein n=1 Tax=Niastella soli TaxID=2821487 RepID=A0ABS3YUB4_9BACT|nr:hypothetical protein [Niastella soli]MBO9200786.1 hypothetical protein [Niastella soli]